ncbi:RNB domain [seawater metagenome]|uniref:RNB domain n=1 Tax=seawater metagenome TaxID=1561972 RepID=A0A5E8CJI2_9ZZZZ
MIGSINIEKPNYNKISLENSELKCDLSSITEPRFFHEDKISWKDDQYTIIESPIKSKQKKIAGILLIKSLVKYGTNKRKIPYYLFKPLDWRYPSFIVASKYSKRENIYVEIEYHDWQRKIPYGNIVKILGPVGDYNSDIEGILSKYNLNQPVNDKRWIKELKITEFEDNLKQYRKRFDNITFSIDPSGCKDIDDALHIADIDSNQIEVGVHIADVSAFVKPESVIDKIARERLSSVYCPHKVITMLPPLLSYDMCSLLENQSRLTMSLVMRFDKEGHLLNYQIHPGMIICQKNFSYQEVDDLLKLDPISDIDKKLHQLFDFTKNLCDDKELLLLNSHTMVEKYMILANELVCKSLIEDQNLEENNILIRTHCKNNEDLSHIPLEIYNNIYFKFLNSAEYKSYNKDEEIGHYGLNLKNYTHFTSPIRRYADIIVHRLLKFKYLKEGNEKDLDQISAKINEKNRIIKKMERNIHFINVIYKIPEEDCDTSGYVTDINKETFKISIYIPEFNLEIDTYLFSSKLNNLLDVVVSDDEISVSNNDQKVTLTRYQKVEVKLIAREKEGYINKKVWADVISPSFVSLLN